MKQFIPFYLTLSMAGIGLLMSTSLSAQQQAGLPAKSTEVSMPAAKPLTEETWLNTVSTIDTDGRKYRLVVIGDAFPKFYVNGELLSRSDMEPYDDIIEKLTPVLWQRQKQAAEQQKKEYSSTVSAILKELVRRHYVKDEASVESFLLSRKEFIINKQKQGEEMFMYFRTKFGSSPDGSFYYDRSLPKN